LYNFYKHSYLEREVFEYGRLEINKRWGKIHKSKDINYMVKSIQDAEESMLKFILDYSVFISETEKM
jgi:hypothetical protein